MVPPDLLSELNGVVDEFVELSRDLVGDKRFDVGQITLGKPSIAS